MDVCREEVSSVEDEIHHVNRRWDGLHKTLQAKRSQIDTLQQPLLVYRDAVSSIHEKLSKIESTVNVEHTPSSVVEEMNIPVQELESLKVKLEELKPEVEDVLEAGQKILDSNPDVDPAAIQTDNNGVQEHYNAAQRNAGEKLEKANKFVGDLKEYWANQLELDEMMTEVRVKLDENKPTEMVVEKLKEQLENTKV